MISPFCAHPTPNSRGRSWTIWQELPLMIIIQIMIRFWLFSHPLSLTLYLTKTQVEPCSPQFRTNGRHHVNSDQPPIPGLFEAIELPWQKLTSVTATLEEQRYCQAACSFESSNVRAPSPHSTLGTRSTRSAFSPHTSTAHPLQPINTH